jgi:hypothetical protein
MRAAVARRLALTVAAVSVATMALAGGAVAAPSGPAAGSSRAAGAACVPGAKACPIRISFARGAYSGHASSTLTGITSNRWFVVRARANQSMIVIVKGAGPTRGIVHFPNGQFDGQPGGRIFDDRLPVSGNYRIEVTESPMAEAWRGRVTVIVVIY